MGTDVGGRRVTNASPGITNPLVPPAGSPASRFHRGAPNLVMRVRPFLVIRLRVVPVVGNDTALTSVVPSLMDLILSRRTPGLCPVVFVAAPALSSHRSSSSSSFAYSQTTPLNRYLALGQRPGHGARHFSFSRLVSFETMPFSSFPLDIVLEVMAWCGPKDLQQLRLVCRLLATLLAKNLYVWRLSRANLGLGFPLPPAARNEAAFASYIFNGGPCTVRAQFRVRRALLTSFYTTRGEGAELPQRDHAEVGVTTKIKSN
ncbi:hypothetical protein B0H11DRAFT_1912245 [Mycena galericulata]|nr:hypothetical protein B0H11DRAFT_1912245 [Mycena galericulata]